MLSYWIEMKRGGYNYGPPPKSAYSQTLSWFIRVHISSTCITATGGEHMLLANSIEHEVSGLGVNGVRLSLEN